MIPPKPVAGEPSDAEAAAIKAVRLHARDGGGYSLQQRTPPQTLGYALTDSPVGQAMWIYEKILDWSDAETADAEIFKPDAILDNIMLYRLTGSATSAAWLYWEHYHSKHDTAAANVPVGCSIFPKDICRAPRKWAEQSFPNLVYWTELKRGGHFAALEQPALFVDELRACFAWMR